MEVCLSTGKTFTACKAESHTIPSPYDSVIIGLTFSDRSILYDRINARVDQMVEAGMVEEAYQVYQNRTLRTVAHAIGYKELIPYFENQMPLDSCIALPGFEPSRHVQRTSPD